MNCRYIANPNESETVARVVYRSTELDEVPAIGRPQGIGATFFAKNVKIFAIINYETGKKCILSELIETNITRKLIPKGLSWFGCMGIVTGCIHGTGSYGYISCVSFYSW